MLEQRIQQHFIDSADLKYQAAQLLSQPIGAAVQAILACVTSGAKVLACGSGAASAQARQFAALCVAGFERERPELAAVALEPDALWSAPRHARRRRAGAGATGEGPRPGGVMCCWPWADGSAATDAALVEAIQSAHERD
ncbi:SIS domain-containing protein, partial [Acidovorax cattleyae]